MTEDAGEYVPMIRPALRMLWQAIRLRCKWLSETFSGGIARRVCHMGMHSYVKIIVFLSVFSACLLYLVLYMMWKMHP